MPAHSRVLRLAALALPACLAVIAMTGGASGTSTVSTPRVVSGPDPLPPASQPNHCQSAKGIGPGDRHNWESESTITAGSPDGKKLAIAWIQDWDDAIAVGHSEDGGNDWSESVPPSSICTPGGSSTYDGGALDPSIAADPGDAGHAPRLYLTGLMNGGGGSNTAVFVTTSLDNGTSWAAPTLLDAQSFPSYVDGSQVVVDPGTPGTAYALWRGGDATFVHRVEYLSRTTDGGATWSAPSPIPLPSPAQMPIPASAMAFAMQAVVLSDHSLVVVTSSMPHQPALPIAACPSGPTLLVASRSMDGGQTWSAPQPISLGDASLLSYPNAAAGPNDSLAVTWAQVDKASGHTKVLVDTWNPATGLWGLPSTAADSPGAPEYGADGAPAARRIVANPPSPLPASPANPFATSCPVILAAPTVAITNGGTIGVLYYSHAADGTAAFGHATELDLAQSADGGTTWSSTKVAGPFDQASIPTYSGAADGPGFLGDYQGLTSVGTRFLASYVLASPHSGTTVNVNNPTDVYFSRVQALR